MADTEDGSLAISGYVTFSLEEFPAESIAKISFSNINIRHCLVLTSFPNTAEISLAHTIQFVLTVGVSSFVLFDL
jgi:hypothetical protein